MPIPKRGYVPAPPPVKQEPGDSREGRGPETGPDSEMEREVLPPGRKAPRKPDVEDDLAR